MTTSIVYCWELLLKNNIKTNSNIICDVHGRAGEPENLQNPNPKSPNHFVGLSELQVTGRLLTSISNKIYKLTKKKKNLKLFKVHSL